VRWRGRRAGGAGLAAVWAGRWAAARVGLQRGRRWVGGLAATACWAAVTVDVVRAAGLRKADELSWKVGWVGI
jgi:hypothetical protein